MKKVFFRSLACLISLLTPLSALAEPLPHWDTTCSLAVKADDLQGTIANDVPVYEEAIESNPEAEDTIEVNLYFLNTEYEDYISLPEGYAQSYQIRFSDGSVPTGYHFSGNHDNIDIDANGNVEVVMKSESTVLTGAGVSFYRTYGTEGSCIITVQNDEETLHFKINTISYGSYHAKEVVQEYLDSNISPSMTEMEKLKLICEYVCSFDYKASGMFGSLDAFVYDNGGDCWASTSTVNYMCRQVGLTAWSRNASDDPGAGENHQNSIVRFSDDTTYMVDCGYNEKAPRNYSIKQIETGVSEDNFICTAESDGTVTIKEYLGNIEELVIPQEIGGATVTGIGGSVFSGHTELTSITFPKTLRKISSNCFSGCTNLAAIDFPDSLYDIGQSVFEDTACRKCSVSLQRKVCTGKNNCTKRNNRHS